MNYIGNCTNDSAWQRLFDNASEMAYVIAESQYEHSRQDFEKRIEIPDGAYEEIKNKVTVFAYNESHGIAWAYDEDNDIHYFWN